MTFPYYKGNESAEMEETKGKSSKNDLGRSFYVLNSLKVEKEKKRCRTAPCVFTR